jgi:hypothetical protein
MLANTFFCDQLASLVRLGVDSLLVNVLEVVLAIVLEPAYGAAAALVHVRCVLH